MTSAEPRRRRSPLDQAVTPRRSLEQALVEAIDAVRSDRNDEAEKLLAAILTRWPEQADALHYLGVLRHNQGRSDEAIDLIQRAVAAMPAAPGPWNNLGNVLLSARHIDEAVAAYERSVALAGDQPQAAGAWSNLAVIYRRNGRLAEAESASRKAVELSPGLAEGWYNLSLALMVQGCIHEGLLANSRAIALWPALLQARDQVVRALLKFGERDRAAQLYREWLAEEPDNPVVQHQLAACLGDEPPPRASDAYVETLFDSFAESFDAKLESLHYRAPELVTQALRRAVGEPAAALEVVDVGCGTGLCGPLLQPWARWLAGCDLSVGMLRQARQRQVYDVLHKAELVYYLDTQPGRFDAAISADTLCYFGDLSAVMNAAACALRPGGWLIFTVEALPDGSTEPHRLQLNGRYAHSAQHLRATLASAGLRAHAIEADTLRMEDGRPVAGWLVSAQKP